jgi:hypothetical protein
MNVFHCNHCQQLVFFESVRCVSCDQTLGYLPDARRVASLDQGADRLWTSPRTIAQGKRYRLCANYAEHNVCNWVVDAEDTNPLCQSCRLTQVLPDLSVPGNREAWYKLEVAKRRLMYGLVQLACPVVGRSEDPEHGLSFEFLADTLEPGASPVLTGHSQGVITLNIAEADDVERERRRLLLREPYRTLLGHFRHESGHHYWDRLIDGGPLLEPFRALFGDERRDYGEALQHHYDHGAPENWQGEFISTYASSHPWEDWAETWAHYLHMCDALETAAACGMSLQPGRADEPTLEVRPSVRGVNVDFEALIGGWFPLTYVLNNLNRGLGLPDSYPFVLSVPVIDKLRFVHDAVQSQRDSLRQAA